MSRQSVKVKNIQSWIIYLLIIMNIILFIFISNRLYIRLDFTEGKKYSISQATVDLLQKVDETTPLIIEYFYNDKTQEVKQIALVIQYVKDILEEYNRAGGKKVNVRIKELSYAREGDRDEIMRIEKAGIKMFSLLQREETESKSVSGFSGVILNYGNKHEVLPTVINDVGFEFNLDVQITKLIGAKKEKLGIIIGNKDKALERDYAYVSQLVRNEFPDFQQIFPGSPIPDDISLLLIIGGKEIGEADLYYLDQFLLSGGKAFIALNGVNISIQNMPQMPNPMIMGMANKNLLVDLLAGYGITVNPVVAGDSAAYTAVPQREGYTIKENRYPVWPKIKNINKKHPATENINQMNFFWPSTISVSDKIKDGVQELLKTTKNGWTQKEQNGPMRLNIEDFAYPIQESEGELLISCSYEGSADSYFKNKPIPQGIEEKYKANQLDSGKTQLVVVANEIFLENDLISNFSSGKDELFFLMNAIDWFSKDSSLIQIRNKGKFSKPLYKAKDSKDLKRKQTRIIALTTYILPFFFILLAFITFIRRKQKNKKLELLFAKEISAKDGQK